MKSDIHIISVICVPHKATNIYTTACDIHITHTVFNLKAFRTSNKATTKTTPNDGCMTCHIPKHNFPRGRGSKGTNIHARELTGRV